MPEVKWHPKQARLEKPVKEYRKIISRALQATVWNETVSRTDKWPPKDVEKTLPFVLTRVCLYVF